MSIIIKEGYKITGRTRRQAVSDRAGKVRRKPADLDKENCGIKTAIGAHFILQQHRQWHCFDAMDGLDSIRMSGAQASDWYIDHAKKAMEDGKILFAGKYSEPDYEC